MICEHKVISGLILILILLIYFRPVIINSIDPLTLRHFLDFVFVTENNKINWVAIGAIGVLISYWINVRENNKKIEADLKAKARIEWIQKVREVSSVYISDFHMFVTGNGKSWIEAQKNIELLMLYFGPDKARNIKGTPALIDLVNNKVLVNDTAKLILLNEESNEGKNEYIVKYLKTINKYYSDFEFQKIISKISSNKAAIASHNNTINNIMVDADKIYDYEDIGNGEMIPFVSDVILDSSQQNQYERVTKKIEKLQNEILVLEQESSGYLSHIDLLRDSIRIYLKIEWNIAKEGN